MAGKLGEYKKFANLLVKRDGTVWIRDGTEYPYEKRWSRKTGESDGYKYVWVRGQRMSVHQIMGHTYATNPRPDLFDRVDHINRDRWDCRVENLRWTNAHLNSINRENTANTKFDHDIRMWYSSFWVRGVEHIVGWYRTFQEAHRANMKQRELIYSELEQKLLSSS